MQSTIKPVISVLTPSFNQGRFLEQNIRSVLDQGYPAFEHIVIDGGSTDETTAVLSRYPHVKWISERDRGQADALNKGLAMATGEVVGWVNSDDFYAPGIFETVSRVFEDPEVQWCIGDVADYYDQDGVSVVVRSAKVTYEALARNPDCVRQPGTFFRRSALEMVGGWDENLHLVMDLDLWLRLVRMSNPVMVNSQAAYFRIHEEQKTSSWPGTRQVEEIDRVFRRYGVGNLLRLRHRAKKRYWKLKRSVKVGLASAGLLDRRERR